MSYYKRLKELREDYDKTQREISEVLNTTINITVPTKEVCGIYPFSVSSLLLNITM